MLGCVECMWGNEVTMGETTGVMLLKGYGFYECGGCGWLEYNVMEIHWCGHITN